MICHVHIGTQQEKEAMPAIIATLEKEPGRPADPDTTGLYVVSNHIGTNSSLAFWKDVIKNGPAFANPELFPWTLANSVCGAIARHFGITGPNYTYTCPPDDETCINGVVKQAGEDREKYGLSATWIVIVH
ncbi:MAG: hypothetical protein J0I84_04725 [Terrimonas sp.]|nr:hypothetical protein [Terrimonas sp.]OJY99105.1 MAG: hypothetical protein BGP13_23960 [Sphingobacteriales bacterium 40-81]